MDDFILTDELKLKILQVWEENKDKPLGLKEFCKRIIPDCDSRDKRGIAIRKFLAEREIKLRPANIYNPKDKITLTEEQKEFIINNYSSDVNKGMNSLETARTLFNNKGLTNLDQETRAVLEYIKTLDPKVIEKEDIPEDEYSPPKTIGQAAARVNKYKLNAVSKEEVENSKVQRNLQSLIKFCHLGHFMSMMNNYDSDKDRRLFEEKYVTFTYDKPDLTSEELNLYLNLCGDIVDGFHLSAELKNLQRLFTECSDDSDGKKISMSIVESIKNIRKDIDDNKKRQKQLTDTLQGERNKRIDLKNSQNASLIQLIDFWKSHENRQQIIMLAELKKKDLQDEIKRIQSMEDLKIQVFGLDENELLSY